MELKQQSYENCREDMFGKRLFHIVWIDESKGVEDDEDRGGVWVEGRIGLGGVRSI